MTEGQLPLDGYIQPELPFENLTPPEPREVFMARHIMQQLIADSPYPMNAPTLEDAVWWEAHELEEQNGLPPNVTAFMVHQAFLNMFEGEG